MADPVTNEEIIDAWLDANIVAGGKISLPGAGQEIIAALEAAGKVIVDVEPSEEARARLNKLDPETREFILQHTRRANDRR